ncbi:hypothetical protein [Paraburkholderia bryophila]|uniref:Uncharacterized protein n=1 Tax=Paraburkholderia bryophila TaxID=420952 RepID=A0A7Y9WMA7_9BURK|nr:hypothetical protein [Paraburkholderia bryophila]NYH22890.1 hypothetical protein [Paraburkholderia bryophila]
MDEGKNNRQSEPAPQMELDLRVGRAGWEKVKSQALAAKEEQAKVRQQEALAFLRQTDAPAKRAYLTVVDAAEQLGREPDDLLEKGVTGKLKLYVPVLHEGLYVWPVTERGVPHASLLGRVDGVAPIFQDRLQYGEYEILHPADVKKVKVEQSARPEGYICPDRVKRHLAELKIRWPEGQVARLAERIESLATRIAWVPAFPLTTDGGIARAEMLRVNSDDMPSLRVQFEQSVNASEMTGEKGLGMQVSVGPDDPSKLIKYGERRRKQIEAIQAGAKALGIDPRKISVGQPEGHKNKIRLWCKANHLDRFGAGDDPFDEAWISASRDGLITVVNKGNFKR